MGTTVKAMRRNALEDRHRALGCDLDPAHMWNDMVVPQVYATDPQEETVAVRTAAGLFDVAMLKIVDVAGPGAADLLDGLVTSDVARLPPGQSLITTIVDDAGGIMDDILIYRDAPDRFRISHGSGATEEALAEHAPRHDVRWARDEDVHVLSLQGPLSLALLAPHAGIDLAALPYFGHARTRLFGKNVTLGRGGYAGERGYEVFCAAADAPFVWDRILDAGQGLGVKPASWGCLDIVRVESALLFFPFDMPHPDTTPWETCQHWAVDLDKPAFRGRQALVARRGAERTVNAGLEINHHGVVTPGAVLSRDGAAVGIVNSVTWSRYLMKSLALCAVHPDHAAIGTALVVLDGGARHDARIVRTPFYDPMRLRTHPRAG